HAWPHGNQVRFWRMWEDRSHVLAELPGPIDSVTFSLNGKQLAARSGGTIKVWDLVAGKGEAPPTLREAAVPPGLAPFCGDVFGPNAQSLVLKCSLVQLVTQHAPNSHGQHSLGGNYLFDLGRSFSPDGRTCYSPGGSLQDLSRFMEGKKLTQQGR